MFYVRSLSIYPMLLVSHLNILSTDIYSSPTTSQALPLALHSLFCHLIPRCYLPSTDQHLQELPGCLQANLSCLQQVTSEECSLSNSTGHTVLLLLNPWLTASHYPPIQVQTPPLGFHVFPQPSYLSKFFSPWFSPNSSLTGKKPLLLQSMASRILFKFLFLFLSARVMASWVTLGDEF